MIKIDFEKFFLIHLYLKKKILYNQKQKWDYSWKPEYNSEKEWHKEERCISEWIPRRNNSYVWCVYATEKKYGRSA